MLKLKYTIFSSDCLNEVTTESLMYTRGNSFLVKKCKSAQKTVGSVIRLSGEQIKTRYATKTFLFSQTSAVASGLVHLKKPKSNCAQGKNNGEAYSGYGLNKHLQSREVSGIMLPVQVHESVEDPRELVLLTQPPQTSTWCNDYRPRKKTQNSPKTLSWRSRWMKGACRHSKMLWSSLHIWFIFFLVLLQQLASQRRHKRS